MMIEQLLGVSTEKLMLASSQTIYMVSMSLLIGAILGIPLGILLVLTRKNGILRNDVLYFLVNNVINIVRSVPFIILLVFIMPLTRAIVHTTIGTKAAIIPLIFYITPYLARLIESSLLEVNNGIIEAAESMGATTFQIVWHFMLPEALGSLILSLTTGTIGLIGATAMAGTIGGGGVGDLALTYGYQRFNKPLMLATVIVLVIFVQFIQTLGSYLSRKIKTHE